MNRRYIDFGIKLKGMEGRWLYNLLLEELNRCENWRNNYRVESIGFWGIEENGGVVMNIESVGFCNDWNRIEIKEILAERLIMN